MKIDGMDKEKILQGNLFANCSEEELRRYWDEMKEFYRDGWIAFGTHLGDMRDKYCEKYPAGIVIMEQDLLRAITVKMFDKE